MASSLARLGAALPRLRPRAAARVLPPGRWDAAAVGVSRRAALNAYRCQASNVKAAPTSGLKDGGDSSKGWRIKMLYDGDCPLCMREVNMLRERNESYGAIKFVDISSKDYSPEENQGLDYETVATIANAVYGVWAKYRMQITGRPPLEEIMASRKETGECKDEKVCKM